MQLASLKRKWRNAGLPLVFYHATFASNVPSLLSERSLVANKGSSICQSQNGFVSLSDRITLGIIEFFGGVVFEFNAPSLYARNKLIAPRDYEIAEHDIERYDELPFFENEWIDPRVVVFELNDINKVLLITGRDFQESVFEPVATLLEDAGISYCFLSERWLPNKIATDIQRYFFWIESWKKFICLVQENKN